MVAQSEADKSANQAQLLQLENGLNPVDVIFHYKPIDLMADIAHSARKAGSQLLMFMARQEQEFYRVPPLVPGNLAQCGSLLLAIACTFGLFYRHAVGGNNLDNAMGSSVGAQARTSEQAIIITMMFELAGRDCLPIMFFFLFCANFGYQLGILGLNSANFSGTLPCNPS
jgi:hypothetical protein